jgi:hypothetical protein
MFGWFKKAKTIMKPFYIQIEEYLKENAPDVLENYDLKNDILYYQVKFIHKTYEKRKNWNQENTFGFRIRGLSEQSISPYDLTDAMGYLTKTVYHLCLYEDSWKEEIDTIITKCRAIAKELDESFDKAKVWFDLLNDNGLNGFSFSINFCSGKVYSISVVPGNLKKYLDYIKPEFKDPMEYTEYENYCYKRFKEELEPDETLDAYGPLTSMTVPKEWLLEKHEQEVAQNDADYINANEKCKDILDKIKLVKLDK